MGASLPPLGITRASKEILASRQALIRYCSQQAIFRSLLIGSEFCGEPLSLTGAAVRTISA